MSKIVKINDESNKKSEISNEINKVSVYFVRHLRANYQGETRPVNMNAPIDFEGTLIPEELSQLEITAKIILKKMNEKLEIALFSASPRKRAFDTACCLKDILAKNGICISRGITTDKKLIDATLTGEFLATYNKRYEQNKNLTWMEFLDESEYFKNVESIEDLNQRAKEVLLHLMCFKESDLSKGLRGDKISLIKITHEEIMRKIAKIFGIPIKQVGNGEVMEIVVYLKDKKMTIEAQGQTGVLSFEELNKMEV